MSLHPSKATQIRILLPLCLIASVFLRVWFIFPEVKQEDYVRFQAVDSWYHMRTVDNLVEQMPVRLRLDPYAQYPDPGVLQVAPLFDYLVAGTAWVAGIGHPSPWLRDWVGAFVPAILGALICLPIYGIGALMFGRRAGVLAAAWLAIMPGDLLSRSLLGFTDHHVAEVLFGSLAMLFFLWGARAHIAGDGRRFRWLITGVLFGVSLGAYLLTWVGGAFLVLIIMGCLVVATIMRRLTARESDGGPDLLPRIAGVGAVTAMLVMTPLVHYPLMVEHYVLLLGLGLVAGGLAVSGTLSLRSTVVRKLYPLVLTVILGVGFFLLWQLFPDMVNSIVNGVRSSVSQGAEQFVTEARPLSIRRAMSAYSWGFPLAVIGLVALAFRFARHGRPADGVLLVWAGLTLAAMFRQQRFGYYFAVHIALLSGYLVAGLAGAVAGLERTWSSRKPGDRKSRRRTKAQEVRVQGAGRGARLLCRGGAAVVVAFFLLSNVGPAIRQASAVSGPDPGWYEGLRWLRTNTPKPFRNHRKYTARYIGGPNYVFPDTAYGVLSSWDRGYWITRIGRRLPNANPTQYGVSHTARFLTVSRPIMAARIARSIGTKYVILDDSMPLHHVSSGALTGELLSLAPWVGQAQGDWFGRYEMPTEGGLREILLYYPQYFQTMTARLFLYKGKAFKPEGSTVVAQYEPKRSVSGLPVRLITSLERFDTYEAAVAYRDSLPGVYHVLASTDPLQSCVPLKRMRRYELVYESPGRPFGDSHRSHLKIFEFKSEMPERTING